MPIYEYRCAFCNTKFELLRSISRADEPTVCPNCGHAESKRCLSPFAAFSKGGEGDAAPVAVGGSGGCASCSGGSCSTCGH